MILVNHDLEATVELHRGDRIAQLLVQRVEAARLVEVSDLPGSHRGEGGFGSTGGSGYGNDSITPRVASKGGDVDLRANGPWDETEVDLADGVQRLDLGALRVTPTAGIDVQVQVDEASGPSRSCRSPARTAWCRCSRTPRRAAAASGTTCAAQIKSSINQSGGLVEEAEGPFGPELRAQVTASDGTGGLQPARFTGIEGPRWFLRAVFLGAAAREGAAATALEDMVRSLVVVRGGEAMPVGAPIPLVLPQTATPEAAEADAAPRCRRRSSAGRRSPRPASGVSL